MSKRRRRDTSSVHQDLPVVSDHPPAVEETCRRHRFLRDLRPTAKMKSATKDEPPNMLKRLTSSMILIVSWWGVLFALDMSQGM